MRLRIDTFTWVVIAVVLLLVGAAVVSVNLMGNRTNAPAAYMTDDSPAAPVYNAILAVQEGDLARARAQFAQEALAQNEKNGYDPIANAATQYQNNNSGRRVRIVEVKGETESEAYVTIAEDNFAGGGLFGRSTFTNERVIRVVREEGAWKVADPQLFY